MPQRNGDSSEELRRQLANSREKITRDVQRVAQRVRNLADWHELVARYPWSTLAAALTAGFLVVPTRRAIVVRSASVRRPLTRSAGSLWSLLLNRLLVSASQVAAEYAIERLSRRPLTQQPQPDREFP